MGRSIYALGGQKAEVYTTPRLGERHVEDKMHALLLLDAAERIFVYPEFADLLPHLPKDKVVLIARRSHPLCAEYPCAEEPPC